MTTYRAAYIVTAGDLIVLTLPEHAGLSDGDLIAAALPVLAESNAAALAIGADGATASDIIIGAWTA